MPGDGRLLDIIILQTFGTELCGGERLAGRSLALKLTRHESLTLLQMKSTVVGRRVL